MNKNVCTIASAVLFVLLVALILLEKSFPQGGMELIEGILG